MAKAIEDMGAHSLCIKDMAGLLHPYDAYDLVKKLKATPRQDSEYRHQKLHRPMIPLTNSQSYQVYQQSGAYRLYAFSLRIEIGVHLAKQAR
jgi:hypothetical protein